jgi:hypothetical protein
MASPTGSAFRDGHIGPVLGRLYQEVTVALAAVESHEGSYTSGNFTAITGALDDAIAALVAAATANNASNP